MVVREPSAARNAACFDTPSEVLDPHAGRRGFTLVELLLVVAVISIVFAMAMPSLTSFAYQNQSQTILRNVRLSLLTARQKAIDDGTSICWRPGGFPRGFGISDDSLNIDLVARGPLVFYSDGTAVDAKLVVSNARGTVGTLYVVGATGAILLELPR